MKLRELNRKWHRRYYKLANREDKKSIIEKNIIMNFLNDIEGLNIELSVKEKENRELIHRVAQTLKDKKL